MRDRLRVAFDGDEAAIYPNRTDGPSKARLSISVADLLERWEVRRGEIRVVAAHFPLSTVGLLDADFVTMSVLRPPVERTMSYLVHQQRLHRKDRESSLEAIYDDPFRFDGLIRNHMTRMFSIGADEMRQGDGVLTNTPDTPERLARAKDGLESLDALGLQPRFEEFCDSVAERYDLDLGAPLRSNVNPRYDGEVPPSLVRRIEEDNAADMELYEYAEALVARRGVQA